MDQIEVITGGAQALAGQRSKIALWDIDADALAQAKSQNDGQVATVACNIAGAVSVEAAVAQTERELGPITQVVNSAGIAGPNMPIEDYPLDDWNAIVTVNLTGSFHLLRAILPGMKKRGFGRVVLIASVAGKEGNPSASAYSASKAGVIGLTKSAGKECADLDIAINCVTPAAARTRIFDQMSEEHISYMLSKIPRGRFLEVEEAAHMIKWLCSPENSFTNGATFDLSGGRATY
ncbi:MAG: SDR family oxidoreductase [Pseudomonadota bacterium]